MESTDSMVNAPRHTWPVLLTKLLRSLPLAITGLWLVLPQTTTHFIVLISDYLH